MFIETIPNRSSPPAVLLRESYRDANGKAQKRTLANLSKLPAEVVDGLKALLKGGQVIGLGEDGLAIERSYLCTEIMTLWMALGKHGPFLCGPARWRTSS